MPRYAKFLKDLCTHKRRIKGNEKVNMGRNVFALIEKPVAAIPNKCKDPGTFTIPCIIGSNRFENAMLDLGASLNVMPLSVFTSLSLGPLETTRIVIQLANRNKIQPTRLIEDVLIQVNKLVFPVDFYILDMGAIGPILYYFGLNCSNLCDAGFATKANVVDTHLTTLDDSNPDKLQVAEASLSNRPLPSIIQPPSLELKPLPNHLKYAYLEKRRNFQ